MFSRGIVAAMEDEAQAAELAIDDAGSDSMEAGMVDVVDMSANIEQGTSEMSQTVQDADQLERHVEVLSDAEGEGGASPELVEATEIAVEGIFNRLGIYSGTGIPSLESFSTKTGRARNTRAAIESITDKIKQIWQAVKAAFIKLVNYVKDFFGRLTDGKKKTLARITSMEVKLRAVKGTPKEKKVKGSGIGKVFGADAAKGISEVLDVKNIQMATTAATEALSHIDLMVKAVETQASYEGFSLAAEDGKEVSQSAPEGMKWIVVENFGTEDLVWLVPKEALKGKEAFDKIAQSKAKMVKAAGTSESDSELDALDKAEMEKYLKLAREVIQALMSEALNEKKITVGLDKAIAGINRAIALGDKNDDGIDKRGAVIRGAVTAKGNLGVATATFSNTGVLRAVQATLTYVERSLDNFSEETSKDKK